MKRPYSSATSGSNPFDTNQNVEQLDKEEYKTSINEGGEIELPNKNTQLKKDKFRKIK